MFLLALLTILSSLILPEWLSLVLLYLAVGIIALQFDIPPLFSIGEADFLISDLIVITLFFKVLLRASLEKHIISRVQSAFLPGLIAFITVMMFSVLLSGIRFGGDVFLMELVPLLRFISFQIGGFILLATSSRTLKQIQGAQKAVYWLGYFAALSIYLGLLLQPYDIAVGEINPLETVEGARYQGMFGDSVKLILLPFIFFEILSRRFTRAIFFLIALLATGGRMGVIGLLVGLMVIIVLEREKLLRARQFLTFALLAFACITGFWLDIGGIATRFMDPLVRNFGFEKRIATWSTAFTMASENLFSGLGFGGYRLFVDRYLSAGYGYFPFLTDTYSQMLKAVVDGGVLGLIAFLWMMWNFLIVMRRSMLVTQGELHIFFKGGYVFVLTMIILSPIVAWMLPASNVSHLLFLVIGLGVSVLRMREKGFPEARPVVPGAVGSGMIADHG